MMNLKNIPGVYQMSLPDPLIYFNILKGTLIRSSFFPQIKICIFFLLLMGPGTIMENTPHCEVELI